MQLTTNYALNKPEQTDVVNIDDLNGNFDIIDSEIKKVNDNKVDKESGKGLSSNDYTTTEKSKLAGIAVNANNYVHPTTHPPGIIVQDASNRFVSDTEKSTWNGKAAGSHTHTKAQITDFPTSMPANGGNANYANTAGSAPANGGNSDTVDGYHIQAQTTIPGSLGNNVICLVYE